ncbi:MAG TPA: divalent metal cation transporter, partial [Candidatus Hydrogenedentes bacterium]|nr:divalent metal cation transporter [Candidatus Hydrogenedentota bacterium]
MSRGASIARRIGPGLITASVVLGPGSIVSASRAGAEGGYRLLWLMVFAAFLMAVYTSMGARLGCALNGVTPLRHVPRPLGIVVGLSAFFVCAGFQFGNNIGVSVAVSTVTGTPGWIWPLVFTGACLVFLFAAKQIYKALERMMMVLVAVMICAFVANLFWTGVSVPAI